MPIRGRRSGSAGERTHDSVPVDILRAEVPSEVVTDDISDEATFLNAPVDVEGVVPDLDARVAFPDLTGSVFGREPTRLAEKGSYFGVYATVITGGVIYEGDEVRLEESF